MSSDQVRTVTPANVRLPVSMILDSLKNAGLTIASIPQEVRRCGMEVSARAACELS